ncbi:RagB/SusD family nutrient uptake outer membrane protein [Chitinophaga sp. 2R12]|uniref:RagB/SusD family nutrient uptake outer membrane protein n=2 Tax=Chitinophagaceae TaxID=563835 RepID=A0ABS5IXW3_9BACT|nr:RagB/SusD family nutrient uptake outer membrane protein [Chitinophaga hostae]
MPVMRSAIIILILLPLLLWQTGCMKDVNPSDALTTETITSTPDGLKNAVNGAYSLLKDHVPFNGTTDDNNMYLRQYFQLSDFASDDIVCGQTTEDPLFYSFSLDHSPTQTNTRYFWYISYKIINDANTVIEAVEKQANPDATTQQLLGECYFLRAFSHFNLVKLFAMPYTQNPGAAGVILRTSTSDPGQKARASVGEVYKQIIGDAQRGAALMGQARGPQYASREAAWALLSRAYLYEGVNDSTIYYASKVIDGGRYTLTTGDTYPGLFANAMTGSETIFCAAFTPLDDYRKFGSIASMIYSDGNSGWGEEFASASLRDTMLANPEDVRWKYIVPLKDDNGVLQQKNGIDVYYISKFSGQDKSPTLSSPILFRLAELYLNRAEASAKAGNTAAALDDVDMIRRNRGLTNAQYHRQLPAGKSALDIVLKERRLELAFEGHRSYDIYRNKRTMNRTYWGYHLPGLKQSDIKPSNPSGYAGMMIQPDNPKIIYYIPIDEIETNKLCTQNP